MHQNEEEEGESQTRYKSQATVPTLSPSESMEPFNAYPAINPNILTSMPINILRNDGVMRQQEVKWSEEIHYEGRTIEQHFNIFQSDKAQLRALRKGVGCATIKMRPVGDRIVLHINRGLKIELSLPQLPRNVQINNDNMSMLTEAQKKKKQRDLLILAGDGGYIPQCMQQANGVHTPLVEKQPPAGQQPQQQAQQPQANEASFEAVVRAALAATPGADRAPKEQNKDTSTDVAIVAEQSPNVQKDKEALTSCSKELEVVGEPTTTDEAVTPAKKKKDNYWGPNTRASAVKKVQVSLPKRKISEAEKKYVEELKRHEEKREEFRRQIREFNEVQKEVEEAKGEKSKHPEAAVDEIPELRIRHITSVRQEDTGSFENICEGDILDLKEEPDLVVDE